MITGVKSLSTVDIMNLASSQNIELKLISSANSAEIKAEYRKLCYFNFFNV
jgi:hypothetical protein